MTVFELLSVIRRRWIYVALGLAAGLVAGILTAPGDVDHPVEFKATHTLLVDPTSPSAGSVNLDQSALLATTGPVPVRVAERLGEEGIPAPTAVEAAADVDLRSLLITATARRAESATAAADYTAEELNAELAGADAAAYEDQLEVVREQLAGAEALVADLDGRLAGMDPDDPARAALDDERTVAAARAVELRNQIFDLEDLGAPAPPFRTLESSSASRVEAPVLRLPASPGGRGAVLGALGMLLGAVGALAADRLDTRVRGKADAERAFALPVVAEIPPLTGKGRDLVIATRPASPFAEAFRALRTVVLFATSEATPPPGNGARTQAQVIAVTSPSAGEGKTTTAAHLAAVLAESEKRVLVISADFRRPRIHEHFGIPRDPGLSDVLDPDGGRVRLADLHIAMSFSGVHLIPSGGPVDNPARLLTETVHLVAAARHLFDFIILDTPPLLVANDATELAAAADMVLLVAKADRTTRDGAARATEILRRVDAPLLGVVVTAAHDIPSAYGYYRHRYYAESDQGRRRARRKDGKARVEEPIDPSPASPVARVGELNQA